MFIKKVCFIFIDMDIKKELNEAVGPERYIVDVNFRVYASSPEEAQQLAEQAVINLRTKQLPDGNNAQLISVNGVK